jgi:hypothetical protein
MQEAPCKCCGVAFSPKTAIQKYCSYECHKKQRLLERLAECPGCKEVFERKYKTQIYCGKECSKRAPRADLSKECEHCNKFFVREHGKGFRRFCSRSCAQRARQRREGETTARPLGSTGPAGSGYVRIKTETGWKPQHRLVMEQKLGRPLHPDERVHHINGVRDDNRAENLELWGVGHKDPAGVRMRDVWRQVEDKLADMPAPWRERLTQAVNEVFGVEVSESI